MNDFIAQGLEFFRACNSFFRAIGMFLADPLKYLIAWGYWISIFVSVVSVFLKACGFKSDKYFAGSTVAGVMFKIAAILK